MSSGYSKDKLTAIQACIDQIDTPINVRCSRFGARATNQAYLDMMRRTENQFLAAPLINSFHASDRADGTVDMWIEQFRRFVANGYGLVKARLWNGVDIIPVDIEGLSIDGFVVTVFHKRARIQVVSPVPQLAFPLSSRRGHKDLLSIARFAPMTSPDQRG